MTEDRVTCEVCWRRCAIPEGGHGFCRARTVRDGRVVAANYGRVTSLALDPIEKKPLAYFYPGTVILSVGSYGCNMACPFCQNHEIARDAGAERRVRDVSPEALVDLALNFRDRGNIGIAFTYNEPLVGYEYVRDAATLARRAGLETVVVTNGQIEDAPLSELLPVITAWNIDLKTFNEATYARLGGRLDVVKRTIARVSEVAHVEVTTLVVPGISDDAEDMEKEAAFLRSLDPKMPLHLTRYFPCYEFDRPMTPRATLFALAAIARRSLDRVLLGNVY